MLRAIFFITICFISLNFNSKASVENMHGDDHLHINAQGIVDTMPVIFSFLDKNSIKHARLVCNIWNDVIQKKGFDLSNPHLNLPCTAMKKLLGKFNSSDHTAMYLYKIFFRSFSVLIDEGDLNHLKIRVLLCPNKSLRASGYTFLFSNFPYNEVVLMYTSYVPLKDRSEEDKALLSNFLAELHNGTVCFEEKYSRYLAKDWFGPKMLALVEDQKNSNNDRHPLELEALKQYEKAIFGKKIKQKCCYIHEQAQKVARTISYVALAGLIFRVCFGI